MYIIVLDVKTFYPRVKDRIIYKNYQALVITFK